MRNLALGKLPEKSELDDFTLQTRTKCANKCALSFQPFTFICSWVKEIATAIQAAQESSNAELTTVLGSSLMPLTTAATLLQKPQKNPNLRLTSLAASLIARLLAMLN